MKGLASGRAALEVRCEATHIAPLGAALGVRCEATHIAPRGSWASGARCGATCVIPCHVGPTAHWHQGHGVGPL